MDQGGAFGSAGASGDFDFKTFLTKPQVILRISGWVSHHRYLLFGDNITYCARVSCGKHCRRNCKGKLRYFWMERVAGGSLDYRGADD